MGKELNRIAEEKRKLQQTKLLLKLESEIKDLEFKIKHTKVANIKIKGIRNLKISLRFGQKILPYVLIPSVIFGGLSILGATPFHMNDKKYYLSTKQEIDSFGKVRYEYQYQEYKDVSSIVTYYGKWEKIEEGLYKREIKKYEIDEDIAVNAIEKIIKENNINSLEELLGKPYVEKTETKNNLSDKQINQSAYLEGLLYSESENDYIIVKESMDDEVTTILGFILLSAIGLGATFFYRIEYSNFDFDYCVSKIKENHPMIDIKKLKKTLEIRKENYERLTR